MAIVSIVLTVTATMAAMRTVPEKVHAQAQKRHHDKKPVFNNPFHVPSFKQYRF